MTRLIPPHLALCLIFLLGGGCVRSMHPVLAPDQVIRHDAVVGTWVNGDGERVEISRATAEKVYEATHLDKDGKRGLFSVRIGKVGDLLVAEIAPREMLRESNDSYRAHLLPLYSFVILEETAPRLVMRTLAPGYLAGFVEKNPDVLEVIRPANHEVVVVAPTARFQDFLLQHWDNPEARTEPSILTRASDVPKPAAK